MEYLDNMTETELAEFMRQDRLRMVREKRNALLAECDWTQAVDSPLSDTDKAAWATYRQALRDMTNGITIDVNDTLLDSYTWPEKPA